MKKNILVTGGAGYIGAQTCKLLFQNGYIPVVYDNLVYGHKDFVKWGPLIIGDILDSNKLDKVFEKYKPIAVFHFAAFGYIGESVYNPAKYYQNNLIGTILLLNTMLRAKVNFIIFSSSCATFGIPTVLPIDENSVQNPINLYGKSKLFIEKILQDYDCAYGIKSVILRYFNAAGADPDCDVGEDHNPENHLIPLALDVALNKSGKINVFGNDYETFDGTCIRDYVHVFDLAKAHLLALEYLRKINQSDHFNLGIGEGFSIKQILNAVVNVTGSKIFVNMSKRRKGDPPVLVANPEKAIKCLGWTMQYSKIEDIIMHAWRWHKKRFG